MSLQENHVAGHFLHVLKMLHLNNLIQYPQRVAELDDKFISSEDAIVALYKDVEFWIDASKEMVTLAEEAKDVSTADLFTGYITSYEKLLWMLKAYQA